jgi:uncharacterized RDD family membrane protein YckC
MGSALLNPMTHEPSFEAVSFDLPDSDSLDSDSLDSDSLDSLDSADPVEPRLAARDALKLQAAQCLAAHRQRRDRKRPQGMGDAAPAPVAPIAADPRSARIAAAVAARYANSPSYRAVLAAEAERAVRQAQAAAEMAALNAQSVTRAHQELLIALNAGAHEAARPPAQAAEQHGPALLWPEPPSAPDPGAPSSAAGRVGHRTEGRPARPSVPSTAARSMPTGRATGTSPGDPVHAAARTAPAAPGLTVRHFQGAALAGPLATQPAARRAALNPQRLLRKGDHEDDREARALDEEIAFRQAPLFEEPAGPPVPLPANVIEFPRQLVAPRRARPRYAEGPLREDVPAAPGGGQLRIFEVDAAQISTTPEPAGTPTPQWTSIWLDSPAGALLAGAADAQGAAAQTSGKNAAGLAGSLAVDLGARPQTAAISRRLMAAAIDGSLILAGCAAFAVIFTAVWSQSLGQTWAYAATHPASGPADAPLHLGVVQHLARTLSQIVRAMASPAGPTPAAAVVGIAGAAAFLYLLYQTLFFTLAEATPGMRCARIALCTFADENPTRRAMRRRILVVLLSACPLGLGLLWVALDEDGLAWHDRISRMYPRSY